MRVAAGRSGLWGIGAAVTVRVEVRGMEDAMANDPGDELLGRRRERERAARANLPAATDDEPGRAEQEAAIARARESFDLSRSDADAPPPDDRAIEDARADNRS
jgi:hypothetical protein